MSFPISIAPGRGLRAVFAFALLAAFGLAGAAPAEAQYQHRRHDRAHVHKPRPHTAPGPRVRRRPPVVRPVVRRVERYSYRPVVRYTPPPVYRAPERRYHARPVIYPPIYAPAPTHRQYQPWAGCASEPRVCRVPYPTHIRYGARGRYVQLWVRGGPIRCDNYTFGDPIPGVRKSCAYRVR